MIIFAARHYLCEFKEFVENCYGQKRYRQLECENAKILEYTEYSIVEEAEAYQEKTRPTENISKMKILTMPYVQHDMYTISRMNMANLFKQFIAEKLGIPLSFTKPRISKGVTVGNLNIISSPALKKKTSSKFHLPKLLL